MHAVFSEFAPLPMMSAVAGAIALWLRQPVLIGYIVIGIVAGRTVLGLVTAHDRIDLLAQAGGMRALGANPGASKHGVFTARPGQFSNDFFVNLLDMSTKWAPSKSEGAYEGRDRESGKLKWTATSVDLVFGSNSEPRAVAETYAFEDGDNKLLDDFVKAWTKMMNNDRFGI